MTVVGQFPAVKTIAEHPFSGSGDPQGTVIVKSHVCHHLDFLALFGIPEQLPAFPVFGIEEAYAVLGCHYQVVLIGGDVTDNIGWECLRVVSFHPVVCEPSGTDVQPVQASQVGTYPDNVFGGIIIECLYVVV